MPNESNQFRAFFFETESLRGKLYSGIRTDVDLLVSLFITMEVAQAIRKLVYLEDCLIIPGLGGFVSHYRPAAIDKETGTFFPPVKEVVFNVDLVQNDGVLVNFIASGGGISTDQARADVDRFVEGTLMKLKKNEPVFIDGMGQFNQDKNHTIRFQPDPGTNFFLGSYGLSSFHLREVAPVSQAVPVSTRTSVREESPRTIEFEIGEFRKRRSGHTLRRIAIAMPLLIAFALLPYNSRITGSFSSSPASMVPEPSLFRLNYPDAMKRDTSQTIVFPVVVNEVAVDTVIPESVKTEPVATEVVESTAIHAVVGKYPVIAGCFKVKENADRLHKQLVEKGYASIITTSRNGFHKVSVQSFASRQEALDGLARLKKAEPGLELWVAM
jgi:nucleoid DNA-binding protein